MKSRQCGNGDFVLGDWQVRPALGEISDGQRTQRLEPRVMQVLTILAKADGQVVTRDELFDRVWPNQIISDQTLSSLMSQLRRQLGDPPRNPQLIGTVPKKGYRLLEAIRPIEEDSQPLRLRRSTDAQGRPPLALSMSWVWLVFAVVLAAAAGVWLNATFSSGSKETGRPVMYPTRNLEPGSIAVLPFADLSEDASNAYFGDGMAEELLNQLANVPGLQVVARTSSFQYREGESAVDVREIGARLNARFVIEGSVRRVGDQVRVTVQLIDATTGYHDWSKTFDDRWSDLLVLQASITEAVVEQISPQLLGDRRHNLALPTSAAAYDLYLQGRHFWHQRNPAALAKARELFEQATKLDASYALAYAGLADTYISQPLYGTLSASESVELARPLIEQAMTLAPELAEAHLVTGNWYALQTRWAAAESSLRQSIELNPNLAMAHMSLGNVYNNSGQLDQAYLSYEQAQQRNPLHPTVAMNLAQTATKLGLSDQAKVHAKQAATLAPDHIYLFGLTGHVHISAGDQEAADLTLSNWLAGQRGVAFTEQAGSVADYVMCGTLAVFLDRLELAQQCLQTALDASTSILPQYQMQGLTHMAFVLNHQGRTDDAVALAQRALVVGETAFSQFPKDEAIWYEIAVAQALLERTELALTSLQRSIDLGRRDLGRIENDRRLHRLRFHAGYQTLIEGVRVQQSQLSQNVEKYFGDSKPK